MQLNLQRPLLFFDIESTGLNIPADSIIELSFVKVFPGREEPEIKTWRIRPWDYENHRQRHISEEASKVNGVTDDMLTGCPRFLEVSAEIAGWLRDSDLAGFNSAKFDLPMLVGVSRKRVLATMYPGMDADEATVRASLTAAEKGADILRVHDVGRVAEAVQNMNL